MNIQQLRYVVATVEHGSMTAAAEAVFVAQPALSRAVRSLERELGLTLFERSGRGVRVTHDGERFVAQSRRILRGLDELRRLGEVQETGALAIAASPTLQASLALPILAALRDQGVATPVRLVGCASTHEVHERVRSGGADLGLCDRTTDTELSVVPLGPTEVLLVSPPGVDLPATITVADLDDVPLVLPTAGTERRGALDRFFAAFGVTPTIALESDERQVWLESVLRGLASCVWHSVEALALPHEVVTRSFRPQLFQEINAVHRPDDATETTALLVDVLRQMATIGWGRRADPDDSDRSPTSYARH